MAVVAGLGMVVGSRRRPITMSATTRRATTTTTTTMHTTTRRPPLAPTHSMQLMIFLHAFVAALRSAAPLEADMAALAPPLHRRCNCTPTRVTATLR